MEIEHKIQEYIIKNLYYAENHPITADDSFLETGVVDSMGVMELVTFVQAEFGIQVNQDEIVVENFDSIRKLGAFVRKKLAPEAGIVKASAHSPLPGTPSLAS